MTRPRAGVVCKVFSGTCTNTVNRPSARSRARKLSPETSAAWAAVESHRVSLLALP